MHNSSRPTRDDRLFDAMVLLKRHLRSCKECIGARKAVSPHKMCRDGMMLVLKAATQYDDLIRLRIACYESHAHTFYACPDLSKHGKAYSLTAVPLMATAMQDKLF